MQKYFLLMTFLLSVFSVNTHAQCDTVAEQCESHMDSLSSVLGGSVHQVLVLNDTMRLPVTLNAGTQYYLASCSALPNVQYRILDANDRVLFESDAQHNGQHETFFAQSSVNGNIEVALTTPLAQPICTAFAMGFVK